MNYIPQEELLVIKAYEVIPLEYGMAGLGLPFLKHTTFVEKIAEATESYGPDPEFWGVNDFITVPKDEFHVVCAAVSLRDTKDDASHDYSKGWSHPLSATRASTTRQVEICTNALDVLSKASGGAQALEDMIQKIKASVNPDALTPPPYETN